MTDLKINTDIKEQLQTPDNDVIFIQCYDEVSRLIIKETKIDNEVIMKISIKVIKIVQLICKGIPGERKKEIVIKIIKKILADHIFEDENDRKRLQDFVNMSLPSFIDLSVSLATGALDIGKKAKECNFKFC